MMKQHLWALNSSLLSILIITILASLGLQMSPPRHQPVALSPAQPPKVAFAPPLEELYGPRDLFGLFVQPTTPTIKTLDVPKPPQFSPPPPPQVPKDPTIKLVPPLSVSISGIIFSPQRADRSVAMIADDTNKEALYHLGDRIKDGMIIRISQESVVILRSNGQQETFFLRKDVTLDSLGDAGDKDSPGNKLAIETSENTYDLSKEVFLRKIESLGDFLQEFDLMPVYSQGNITGFAIGNADADSFATALGFKSGDKIIKINDLDMSLIANRVTIYETLTQDTFNKPVVITFKRSNAEQKKTITILDRHKSKTISTKNPGKKDSDFERPQQKNNQPMTESAYNEMIDAMRNQLSSTMRARSYAQRVQ